MSDFSVIAPQNAPSSVSSTVLVALLLGSFGAAGGTLLLKLGASGNTALTDYLNLRILAGLTLYALGSGLWIYGMSRAPLSLVYPFSALTFVLVMAAGLLLLGERPSPATVGGSTLILAGFCWIALGSLA